MSTHLASGGLAAGTVVTADYLPWVRVTATSFLEHHPGSRFVVLVVDDPAEESVRSDDRFVIIRPRDVGLTESELGWLDLIYSPLELCCALKPWLVRHLLSSAEVAFYIDADVCVYAPLTDLAQEAERVGVVLSPHALAPRSDPALPDDDALLKFGQFNGGFLAVGTAGLPFVDWWAERCARECSDWDPHLPQRYLDQRWLDLAIGYFRMSVCRDPGVNVARWNLFQRDLQHTSEGYLVDGGPLRCFHFSAFDPSHPERMWRHGYTHPRVDPAQSAALRRLLADYSERLLRAGWRATHGPPPARRFAEIELTPPVRAAIRAALVEAERLNVAPTETAGEPMRVIEWLRTPVTRHGLSWYLWGLHRAHPAVAARFPDVPGPGEAAYLSWSATGGVASDAVPAVLSGPALPLSLNGARSFVALIEADEILGDPGLLDGVAGTLTADHDVTLLLRAPGRHPEAFVREIEPILSAAGLDGPHAPDVLAVLDPVPPQLLAPHVHALFTRREPNPAFAVPVLRSAQAIGVAA